MRPKITWRLACPAMVVLLATPVDLADWRKLLVCCAFFALSLLPFRSFIRIEMACYISAARCGGIRRSISTG
jgi:hypothetical protein